MIFVLLIALTVQANNQRFVRDITFREFDQTLQKNKFVLINYYATWCSSCLKFNDDFLQAGKDLVAIDSEAILAQVEATQNIDIIQKQGIRHYPTLKFYVDGKEQVYDGVRSADGIVEWVTSKTKPQVGLIKDELQYHTIKSDKPSFILICNVNDFKNKEIFNQIASKYAEMAYFYYIHDLQIAEKIQHDSDFQLFVINNPQEQIFKGDFTIQKIDRFVIEESIQWQSDWNQQTANVMFQFEIPILFHFDGRNREINQMSKDNLMKIKAKGDLIICYVLYDNFSTELRAYLQVEDEELPQIRILDLTIENEITQFEFKQEKYTYENYFNFVEQYKNKELKRMLKSQFDLEQEGDVLLVTSNTFKKLVLENTQTIVFFYIDYDGQSRSILPIYNKLAALFKSNIQFAQIDMSENELDNFENESYPSFYFYKNNQKVKMENEFSLNNLIEFLKIQLGQDYIDVDVSDVQKYIDEIKQQQIQQQNYQQDQQTINNISQDDDEEIPDYEQYDQDQEEEQNQEIQSEL